MIPKNKDWRSKKYCKWVASQPCKLCGYPESSPHHLIGVSGAGIMGGKAPDWQTMPLCDYRGCHKLVHKDKQLQEYQWRWIVETLQEAVNQKKIEIKDGK